ncbi:MAG: extracellular solute-binding protein [Spirochaetales bacterium]|nr:extracellular solute-binding protein [Spirochaetales bacterium]
MKKQLKIISMLTLLTIIVAGSLYARGDQDATAGGLKQYTIFLGRPAEDYPKEGTILGNWIEEKTGVRLKWEFPVGDLRQKVGLIIAGGDYPDLIDCRNENQALYDAGAFIPLDDLIEKYGVNAKKLYGKRIDMLRKDDGHIYWFPQLFPYGDKVQRTYESLGLYVQKRVLKEFGWPIPKNLNEAFDMLIEYCKRHPETDGNKTYAYTALTAGWREFALTNAPHVFSGHPNDGVADVDWVGGKWKVLPYWANEAAYKVYKLYNKIHLAGLYDTESFVMDYDQYLAKLASGSILAFCDQHWQFERVRNLLRDQEPKDRWWVGLPVVMEGYKENLEGPLDAQVSEGVGITVDCKDPVGAFKYLDFLLSEECQIAKQWGFQGTDFEIDENGLYYRTPEQIERWDDTKFIDYKFGQRYWIEICGWHHSSCYSDGKNAVSHRSQPAVFYARLKDTEKEVLDAYGKKTWYDFFNPPDMRRAKYFPLWTIKLPTGGVEDICLKRIEEIRRKYIPLLIMAEPGKYDAVWKEFLDVFNKIPDKEKLVAYYQKNLDDRVEMSGGY